ncbi:nucleoside deaminase [Microlunatus soli]|uniref:Cytidine and deoxycytidylate deaminase zinc-binding region n=1 Tax=Microlunatus soli TaxID=630515 RepID=A0A1H1M7Y9_9ACTN|nr:nucleoside deaminase [Microlunatus soli]SDR82662.1 Cytidine and deoxycytidylate deaminase zinc-binding region [Microlunatus soli]
MRTGNRGSRELSPADHQHLRRCVELAEAALADEDGPFGSVLVAADGTMLAEDRNREHTSGDPTAHPEFALARWAALRLTPHQRRGAVVYTSGEHCPMCSAAHGWARIGGIVYAASASQLAGWRAGSGLPAAPVAVLAADDIALTVEVIGPVSPYDEQMRLLHARAAGAEP